MVIEFARNVLGIENANSTELNPSTPYPVVDLLPSQKGLDMMGGTMRLGLKRIMLVKGSRVYEAYGRDCIVERHRHRYGVNTKFVDIFESGGFIVSGISCDDQDNVVEFMELKDHPFYIGTQAHPEFRSKPLDPSPIYVYYLKTVLKYKRS